MLKENSTEVPSSPIIIMRRIGLESVERVQLLIHRLA
jgi:hypothetical protein